MPCVTNLWRKLVQQSKCVLTAKVLQAVVSRCQFMCFCAEIKQTQFCYNFHVLYIDILKELYVYRYIYIQFLIHFAVPREAPTFDVIIVNSTAVNVSWQVIIRRYIYLRMICCCCCLFFSIDMFYLFPPHFTTRKGEFQT